MGCVVYCCQGGRKNAPCLAHCVVSGGRAVVVVGCGVVVVVGWFLAFVVVLGCR